MKDYTEHTDPPKKDEGWIEYGLQLLWSETNGYEHVADNAAEELAALRDQLAEANEIISMVDAAVHRDDVESVKSLAYEYVNKYGVQA